jgi:hypothetical protein
MLKAEIRNGSIVPLEPLPKDWNNGTKLSIEPVSETPEAVDQIDRDFDELERICSQGSESDFKLLQKALDEADREAKAWMRHVTVVEFVVA